jgi:hypothetical protein
MLPPSNLKGLDALAWVRRRWVRVGFPAFVGVGVAVWYLLPHERWRAYYVAGVWILGLVSLRIAVHYATIAARDRNKPDSDKPNIGL